MAAFRGLHQEDRAFRGLALEYLDTLLPSKVRDRLRTILEEPASTTRALSPEEEEQLMQSLLRSSVTRAGGRPEGPRNYAGS